MKKLLTLLVLAVLATAAVTLTSTLTGTSTVVGQAQLPGNCHEAYSPFNRTRYYLCYVKGDESPWPSYVPATAKRSPNCIVYKDDERECWTKYRWLVEGTFVSPLTSPLNARPEQRMLYLPIVMSLGSHIVERGE